MYKKIATLEAFKLNTFDFVYRRGVLRVMSNIYNEKLHPEAATRGVL